MKVTVCELPNDPEPLESAWEKLVTHVNQEKSELVVLPEMPFYRWLAHTPRIDAKMWVEAVWAHERWIKRLPELAPALVISSRPIIRGTERFNYAYTWEAESGVRDHHAKYYLPDEPEFWEASWYKQGFKKFPIYDSPKGKIGIQVCTEIWFFQHAREYGKMGAQILACPRATPHLTAPKWLAGGQTAAVVSGAYCLSSNLSGVNSDGVHFAGVGWIIEPEEGKVLGLTSAGQPFLTMDIDLQTADAAKRSYPRYVLE